MQVSFLFGATARKYSKIYSSITKDLNLIGQYRSKTKSVGKLDSFEHIRWYSSTKSDKCSSCYLSLFLSEQVVYFHETDYCIIFGHYLQLVAEVLQSRCS